MFHSLCTFFEDLEKFHCIFIDNGYPTIFIESVIELKIKRFKDLVVLKLLFVPLFETTVDTKVESNTR